ncbi:high frequency lysogenization protein HflD [Marinihelvus fidelis]|nr:high frequency lysogenization protein HflD [Marinihelvus fidelis]
MNTEQVLALAGVFQATELVRQAAHHGTWSGYAATTCLDSLFRLEADTAEDVFGGKSQLRLGLETLAAVLEGEQRHAESLQYTVGLMQLQRRFMRDGAMQALVGEKLADAAALGEALSQHERQDLQADAIAALYSETLSTLTPRIVVHGRPQYLQNPRTVSWVRSLLFAGLRSAVLWRQVGGGRFSLLFGRKKALEQAHRLLAG